jgi:hypothetical protein
VTGREVTRRLGAPIALAAALLAGPGAILAPAPALAARPALTFVTQATYDVRPDEARVAVSVRLTATNHLRNTVTREYSFRTGFLTVLPGTSSFAITGGGGAPGVSVSEATPTYTTLRIDLGANLRAGKSTTLDLTFDLADEGGPPDRPVRISPSLVTFDAWAFATPDTPGSSVVVRLPTGYSMNLGRGPLIGPEPAGAGLERWGSGPLDRPLEFVADVDADRPLDYRESARQVQLAEGPATVLIRAWPDDLAWHDRIADLVDRALPALEREIGLPWPIDGPLAVHEALVRKTGGYAGSFDPADRQIEIAYAAPDGVVLHELAHAWFNGALVADRWAAEGFASYYAERVADELGLVATPPSPDQPGEETIPLNAWGETGTDTPEAETYAYSASLELARAIAERARPAPLRRVWARAAAGEAAYPGEAPADNTAAGAPDWRGLLDLLEEETGEPFEDLWREVVARPQDIPALDARALARGTYERSLELAGGWRMPPSIRDAMRAWRFADAAALLADADAIHEDRVALEATAATAGLRLPTTLRSAFEGPDGPSAAGPEVAAELVTVQAILDARAERPAGAGLADQAILAVGLVGSQPELELATAEAALTSGDLAAATAAANRAAALWSTAPSSGRARILSTAMLALAVLLLAGIIRVRRRTSPRVVAAPADPTGKPIDR